ncbi:hypothetical protein D1610_12225 [Sphingomonas gilva]|uniref:DUF883 family protein n=1 Tax=Sphingomonas gilva TaxID=2305907 RepID=A0A396RLU1_9SPHN|nr:hypothetical protein [Sphingomonas gilva]RHW17298.1 hypothetical protein D1610_12225 [Sphingomonas gilva]
MTDPQPTPGAANQRSGRVQAARDAIEETAHNARETMEQSYRKARAKASSAYAGAKDGAGHAVQAGKRTARTAARKTADTVDSAPLAVLIGGLAVGALAGGLLPRTRREAEVLGPVGRKVTGTATAAARAARTAGKDQLDAAGITTDNARSQLSSLVEGVFRALAEAGNAATAEVKRAPRG